MSGPASRRILASALPHRLFSHRWSFVVAGLAVFFIWLVGRQHHPVFGLTRFFQLDTVFAARALPDIHQHPVYVHRDTSGYDGQFYAQLALRPTLRDPQLDIAIDNPAFRARRMLVPWLGWLLGGGDSGRILSIYPWINVVGWFVFGGLLFAWFPPRSGQSVLAWAGLMFSGGVLTSVRNALTDLPALMLVAAALLCLERRRPLPGVVALAAATLSRETSVLAASVFMPESKWLPRLVCAVAVALPTGLWLLYVRAHTPPSFGNLRNFGWPFESWGGKWGETIALLVTEPANRFHWGALGSLIGISVHPMVIWLYRGERDRWWWLASSYAFLLVMLGPPTFSGFPMAAARILLPSHLAFNVLALRRGGWVLLLLGNLSFGTGWIAMTASPVRDGDELFANTATDGSYLGWTEEGWYQVESNDDGRRWVWSSGDARLRLRRYPSGPDVATTGQLHLNLLGATSCTVTVTQGDRELWTGTANREDHFLTLDNIEFNADGRAELRFHSSDPPFLESGDDSGRHLVFALYDLVGGRD